jgi:hypothetical protein
MNISRPKTAPGKSVAKAAPSENAKSKRRRTVAALLLLLLLGTWYLWPSSQKDRVLQMQQELFAMPRDQASAEERKAKFEELRAEREKLSPAERDELRKDVRRQMQKKMNAEAAKYLAMSPAERKKVIDDRIAREQAWQKQAQSGGPKGTPNGPGRGPGSGGGPGPGGGGRLGGPGPGQAKGGGGPGSQMTAEERDNVRREFLINASPQARAGMDLMRQDTATRRAQLGLPPSKGRGGP